MHNINTGTLHMGSPILTYGDICTKYMYVMYTTSFSNFNFNNVFFENTDT